MVELGEGAVNLAVEHGLVADEGGDLSGGGEGAGEGAALEAELAVLFLILDLPFEAGNAGLEAVQLLLEVLDEGFAEFGGGEMPSRREEVGGEGVEVGAGFFGGGGVSEVGEALEELQVVAVDVEVGLVAGEGIFEVFEVVLSVEISAAAFVEGFADGAGLEALGAAESPEAGGDAVDEHPLDNVAGVEVVLQLAK